MLPPKEEGEAAHLLYTEDFTPIQKSVSNNNNNFDQEFQSPSTTTSVTITNEITLEEETQKLFQDDDSSESSDRPESPNAETSTSLVIIDSDAVAARQSSQNEIEIVQVLKNLENVKTPEPSELDNSIVRASFVDFSADDEIPENRSSVSSSSHRGQPLEEESGEDDDKEFSLTLNPDLPKIRAQQIQNWLEFEKDQELSHDGNNNMIPEESDSLSMLGDSINNEKPVNVSQDFDLDSLSEAGQISTLTGEDADGMGRRVRFLTDPEGNILISVYLTKLVQLILSILKLATAGYLDFTSSKPPSLPATTSSSSTLLDTDTLASFGPSSIDSSEYSPSASCHSDNLMDFSSHFNETDDITNISGEGEEVQQIEVMQQIQAAQPQGDSIPKVIAPQTEEELGVSTTMDEIDINDKPETDNSSTEESTENKGKESSPVRVIDEVKKVISVDPSLSLKDFEEEDTGSDTETLSTSSCSSMIEVIPKEKPGDIQFIKEEDENNNELKTDVIYLDDPEIKDKSITCYEFQPEKEIIPSAPSESDISTVVMDTEINANLLVNNKETTLSAQSVENGDKTSGEVASSPSVDTQSDNNNNKKQTIDLLKFNPIIEQENYQARFAQNTDMNNNFNDVNNEFKTAYNNHQQDILYDEQDPEKQLVSLCIEEEPISAVALTIAKWESFSKKQQQMEQSERSNMINKGKVHLQSYTNNSNNNVNTNNGPSNQSSQTNCQQGKGIMSPKGYQLPSPSSSSGPNAQQIALAAAAAASSNIHNSPNGNSNKTAPGWNPWTNNNKANNNNEIKNNVQEEEEAIYAQPNSQAGSITTSLANPSAILRAYPKPNSRGEIINWFKEGEIHRSGILLSYGQTNHHSHPVSPHQQTVTSPVIVSWFFGLITRQQAEELLHNQPTGTFLVRISTRIWGYTLSYQFNNKTKHFLISAINPAVPATLTAGVDGQNEGQNGNNTNGNGSPSTPGGKKQLMFTFSPGGRYAFIGTNMTPYTTLTSLIRHHSHAPITKAGGEKLTIPCPGGPKIAGIEYVFK